MHKKKPNTATFFANAILIAGIITFLAISVYAYHHHRNDIHGYYLISGVGMFALAFVLLSFNEKLKINFALLLISFFACLYTTEISLQYYGFLQLKKESSLSASDNTNMDKGMRKRINLSKSLGIPFDERSKLQVVMDLRKEGIDAYPALTPLSLVLSNGIDSNGDKIFPLNSISNKILADCNESGEYSIFKNDEHGFRNPEGLYDKGDINIVLIGDSYVHGACVQPGEEIAGWLRRAGKNVLNLGFGGAGPLIEIAILQEYAKPLKPKYVFWFYYEGNDMSELMIEKSSPLLMKYLDNNFSQDLLHKQKQVDKALIAYIENEIKRINSKKNKSSQIDSAEFNISIRETIKLSTLRDKLGLSYECTPSSVDPLFRKLLAEAKNKVDSWNGQFIVVYVADWSRFTDRNNLCRKRSLYLQKQMVSELSENLDIPFIDIEKVFKSHNNLNSLFPLKQIPTFSCHYGAEGYRLIAQEVMKHLSDD